MKTGSSISGESKIHFIDITWKDFFHSVILLLFGLMAYIFWRPEDFMNGIFVNFVDISEFVIIPPLLAGSLPDALWYAALLNLQPNIFFYKRYSISAFLTSLSIALPFVHESLQYAGLVAGSFCWIDILSYFSVLLIFIAIWLFKKTKSARFCFKSAQSYHS